MASPGETNQVGAQVSIFILWALDLSIGNQAPF
jgi:hypothetical protein